jgi:hypothetical protein
VSGAPPTGDLFTEDAIIQELQEGRWQRGREKIDGVSPLADYAPREIARCARLPNVKGINTHAANAGVDLTNPSMWRRFGDSSRRRTPTVWPWWSMRGRGRSVWWRRTSRPT